MIDVEHQKAYSEVLEILKFISKEDYNKIEKEKINILEKYCNKEYKFVYDPKKSLREQNVSNIAEIILGIFFRDYWANDSQRNIITVIQNNDRIKLKEKMKEQYNPNNLFKKNKEEKAKQIQFNSDEVALLEYKESIFKKIIINIRKKFNIYNKQQNQNSSSNTGVGLIMIHPEYQGEGLGSKIIKEYIDLAKKSNKIIKIKVYKENPAKRLYERLEFKIYNEDDTHLYLSIDFNE